MRNDIESLARKMTGNWRKFDSFCWHRQYDLESPEDWTIVYTHGRDSGLVAQSNAHAIQTAMRPFLDTENPDVIEEHHGHWGCGWIDGYAIRVFRNEEITPAFQAWANLHFCMQDYPLLDEEDYSHREYEADDLKTTVRSLADAAWEAFGPERLIDGYDDVEGITLDDEE